MITAIHGFETGDDLTAQMPEWTGELQILPGYGRFGGNALLVMQWSAWEQSYAAFPLVDGETWYEDSAYPTLGQGCVSFALNIRSRSDPLKYDVLAVVNNAGLAECRLSCDHNGLMLEDAAATPVLPKRYQIQDSRWYWVQISWDITNATLGLWVDGAKIGEIANAEWGTQDFGGPARVVIGNNYGRISDGLAADVLYDDFIVCDEYSERPLNGTCIKRAECGGAVTLGAWQGYESGPPEPAIWEKLRLYDDQYLYSPGISTNFLVTNQALDLVGRDLYAVRFVITSAGGAWNVTYRVTVDGAPFDSPLSYMGGSYRDSSRTFAQNPITNQPWQTLDLASGNLGWGIQDWGGGGEIFANQATIEYAVSPASVSGLLDSHIKGHLLAAGSGQAVSLGLDCCSGVTAVASHGHLVWSGSGLLTMPYAHDVALAVLDSRVAVLDTASGSVGLIVGGFIPRPGGSCPLLDPTASIQIGHDLIGIYQSRIDALINQLGVNIHLEFEPVVTPCDNCGYDSIKGRSTGVYKPGGTIPFAGGHRCPKCKGEGVTKTVTTQCIKCLVKWNPEDYRQFGVEAGKESAIVRTKGLLTDAPAIMRASTALINLDIEDQMRMRVRRLRGPIPVGLREDRYAITFWELIDSE